MFGTVANRCLIQAKTLLKSFKRFSAGLADLADDGVGGCAAGNAHLKVVTIPMPRFRLGCHTLAILIQLPAAVSSSDFQGCLPVGQGKLKIISRVDKKKFRFGSVVSLGIQDRFVNFKDLLIGTTNEGQK